MANLSGLQLSRDDLFVVDSVAPTLVFRIDQHIARAVRVLPKKKRTRR